QKGQIKTPDQFFGKVLREYRFGARASKVEGVLRQITLDRSLATKEARANLIKEARQLLGDLEASRRWYHDSHAAIEAMFRAAPDVTLLDGTRINPADLMYQLIAATSVQKAPRDNLTMAAQ